MAQPPAIAGTMMTSSPSHAGCEAALQPGVVVVHVEGDEGIRLPRFVPEARCQAWETRGHVGHDVAQRRPLRLDRAAAVGELRQDGGQLESDAHRVSSSMVNREWCIVRGAFAW